MIDLSNSKAFDGIIHDVMIGKLLKSSLPKIIVETIGYMLKNTFSDVRFNEYIHFAYDTSINNTNIFIYICIYNNI